MATVADSGHAEVSSDVAVSFNKPVTAQTYDIMFVAHVWRGNANSVTTPADMSTVAGITNPVQSGTASSDVKLGVHWTEIDASSPASWTWTISAAGRHLLDWALLRGVDPANVVDIANESGADLLVAPSIVTVTPETLLVYVAAHWDNAGGVQSFTPPTGMTEVVDSLSGSAAVTIASQNLTTAGATGTRTATAAVAGSFVSCNIAFGALLGNVRVWDGAAWALAVPKQVWDGNDWA